MEAIEGAATDAQVLAGIGDENSQDDVWGNVSRAITANGTPSPHLSWKPTEQEMFAAMVDRRLDEPPVAEIGGGLTARAVAAMNGREMPRPAPGAPGAALSHAEPGHSFSYT